jgi:hypothetical protein
MHTPPTSASVQITIEGDLFADLEKWQRRQVNVLPRTFAVRELLARALATERRRARSAGCGPLDRLASKRGDSRP